MFINNSFGKTIDVLHRSMDAEWLRRGVISNNIANVDTKDFKRTVVNFESQLKLALRPERETKMSVTLTGKDPIPDYRDVRPERALDHLTMSNNNGNNVDIEEESNLMLLNQMRYEMMSRSVGHQFQMMNIVLR